MELLTHGSLERKRHGLLGFHPNHAHYISMLMEHEMVASVTSELMCVCLCVAENTSVYSLSKFSKSLW